MLEAPKDGRSQRSQARGFREVAAAGHILPLVDLVYDGYLWAQDWYISVNVASKSFVIFHFG
jgi:hypothetical protein